MGWEIHPPALGDLLRGLHTVHRFPRFLITENGAAMPDVDRVDGRIIDHDRLEYIAAHLAQVHQAMEDGVPVEGYFAWSLLDNFEWAHGYGPKFGLVEVDSDTQHRTPKQSALWYAEVARSGEIQPRETPLIGVLGVTPGAAVKHSARRQPSPRLTSPATVVRRPGSTSMPRRMWRSSRSGSNPSRSKVGKCALSGGTQIRAGDSQASRRDAVISLDSAAASSATTGASVPAWATR